MTIHQFHDILEEKEIGFIYKEFDLPNWLTLEETKQVLTERGYIDEEE